MSFPSLRLSLSSLWLMPPSPIPASPLSISNTTISSPPLSHQSLKSLPFGTNISTLLAGHSLLVTTLPSNGLVLLNNFTIMVSPIFDDGSLIIFGTNKFFDSYFRISGPIKSYRAKNLEARVLKSKGCSVMA
ncbi:hypothetical protein M0R45_015350 [Rubus argutus]|uniref:Uncharacterized protein n=1 Tax=Rubus argutus TaxID=59490 RepID=A0AAW1XRT3_RUBAR